MPHPTKDMTRLRFGRLLVLREDGRTPLGKAKWFCRCDCGNTKTVSGYHLRQGSTKSCGCSVAEFAARQMSKLGQYSPVRSRHPLRYVYASMLDRCYNANNPMFRHYGQRGIKVCDRWRYGDGERPGFDLWLDDMGPRPDGKSIDRINNDGDYETTNCRWADNHQQRINSRSGRKRA
jgi:hypothetical protein